jgi:hypothetical protein
MEEAATILYYTILTDDEHAPCMTFDSPESLVNSQGALAPKKFKTDVPYVTFYRHSYTAPTVGTVPVTQCAVTLLYRHKRCNTLCSRGEHICNPVRNLMSALVDGFGVGAKRRRTV